ncbi:MAG: hypothetical protein IH880_09380 [Candidatus Marinimicrobia bacterium]|nr:hypothetical protein [Candidatus Neomarinimicrobiota bacterium]
MKVKSIIRNTSISVVSLFLIAGIGIAQDYGAEYSQIFSSTNIEQWETQGNVLPELSDGSLSFVFPYDEDLATASGQDTIVLKIRDPIDLSGCSTVFVRYRKENILPNDDSWVLTNIRVEARHEHNVSWFRIYENISDYAGWVNELRLRFKVVVKTDRVYPGTFKLHDMRVEGTCE